MILIILGTQPFQMNRLLKMIDDLIEAAELKESVFAQIGLSDYKPKHYEYIDFLSQSEFEEKIEECSILITHSGVGTIVAGMEKNKPIIVVPRLSKYGEHVDDHQLEIAKTFSEQNYVLQYQDGEPLQNYFIEAKRHIFAPYISEKKKMCQTIIEFIRQKFE